MAMEFLLTREENVRSPETTELGTPSPTSEDQPQGAEALPTSQPEGATALEPVAIASQSDVRPREQSPNQQAENGSRRTSRAQTILESFRAYKRRKFRPNLVVCNM